MERILDVYYVDNARKLHKIVDKILLKFGGISDKDLDDFYSLANEVFVEAIRRYDESQSFDIFLYSCLFNRIKSEMSRRNREKRKADRTSISIDTPVGDDEDITVGDMIADDFTIEKVLFEKNEDGYSKRMLLYLSRLSGLQREILRLHTAGYPANEIRDRLHITEKEYANCNAAIHCYKNVSVLF